VGAGGRGGVVITTVQQSNIEEVHSKKKTVNKKESNKFKSITIGFVSQTISASRNT